MPGTTKTYAALAGGTRVELLPRYRWVHTSIGLRKEYYIRFLDALDMCPFTVAPHQLYRIIKLTIIKGGLA